MSTCASLDIGSQTIRLLIAQCDGQRIVSPLYRDRCIACLGEGMHAHGILSAPAIERAVGCIARFAEKARTCGAVAIHAVATACVREASNASFFLERVNATSGILPFVLSGQEEALMMLAGVQSALDTALSPPVFIMDIGGGSTEFITLQQSTGPRAESLPLGVIALAESHLRHDPPLPHEISTAIEGIRQELQSCACATCFRNSTVRPHLIGTAGTVTTLAAMDQGLLDYAPDRINGYVLSRDRIQALLKQMLSLQLRDRSRLPGLEAGRALVIIPGTLTVLAVMEMLRCPSLTACDAGLLEGALLHGTRAR